MANLPSRSRHNFLRGSPSAGLRIQQFNRLASRGLAKPMTKAEQRLMLQQHAEAIRAALPRARDRLAGKLKPITQPSS